MSFGRVLHAEWIKLWSLRSTYWTILATLAAMVLIGVMLGVASLTDGGAAGPDGRMAIGLGYSFAQVVVAVLGVLTITGEYSTGMIRSTLAAVPTRLPVLAAKAVLVATVGFALGVVGVAVSYLASYPLLGPDNVASLADAEVRRIFWGSGLYLAGVGLLSLAIGAIIRHSAGAITLVLGVLLLLSTLWQLLMMTSDWFTRSYAYLPSVAGERIAAPEATDSVAGVPQALAPWQGFAVFALYIGVALTVAAVLLRKRDG
ncbi:ABC transporter permease [Micromonospora sp. NPDC049497]|uniref:ABC transporter permease n=1 Tax=Micromonospora sp. NPDC049497 TaxID=3364273 RepID=UPI00379CA0AE